MSKVAIMMTVDRAEGQMSSHFGKAPWVMVADTESGGSEFFANEGLHGRSAVEIVTRQCCADVLLSDVGDGALRSLQAAHIHAWAVPRLVAGSEALRMFATGELPVVPAARVSKTHGEGHGCCCSSGHGCCGAQGS